MDADINEHFHQIDKAIRDKLSEKDIRHLFKKAKELIDEFEGNNETKYRNFRYQYHAKRASYFKAINRLSDAKKEELLAKKYNTKETLGTDHVFHTGQKIAAPTYNIAENNVIKTLKQDIENALEKIRSEAEEAKWTDLKNHIQRLCTASMTSFVECLGVQEAFSTMNKFLDGNATELLLLVANETSIPTQEADDSFEYCNYIVLLRKLCDDLQQQQLVEFAQYLLSDSVHAYEALFGDVSPIEYSINNRYKQLARLFHPDSFVGSEVVGIFTELFQKIVQMKETKLEDLQKRTYDIGKANYYENEGTREWDIAQDFKNAAKSNYGLMKVLKKESIQNWLMHELENAKIRHALLAFAHYRAAMLALGAHVELKDSVRLRKYMTLCLILAGPTYTMDAELYAIGTIYTIVHESETLTLNDSDLKDMNCILDRVRNVSKTHSGQQSMPETENRNDTVTETSLVPRPSEIMAKYVPNTTKNITIGQRSKIKREMSYQIYDRCIIRADERLVKYYSPSEKILEVKRNAMIHRAKGIAAGITGAGGFSIATGGFTLLAITLEPVLTSATTIAAVGAAAVVGPIALVISGLLTLAGGLYFGYKFLKMAGLLMREPEIREKLNKMMENALDYFKKGEYEEFFKTLASPYVSTASPDEPPLIEFQEGIKIDINPTLVVQQLLKHEFRPDGIAYLLNIMGEVLVRLRSRKIIMETQTQSALNELAIKLFQEIYSNKALKTEAGKLDKLVKNAQFDKDKQESLWKKIKGSFLRMRAEKFYSIPSEYLKAAEKAPFTARLEEIENIARMNFATLQIIIGDDDNLNSAKTVLIEVKALLTKKFQFFCAPELRLQALEDWLFALGIYDDPEPRPASRLALSDVIQIEELRRVQYVQVEEGRISIQGFIAVPEKTDLWEYLFHFLPEITIWSREEFVEVVKQSYKSQEKFKIMMDKILEVEGNQQCALGVQKWCSSFLNDTHFLDNRYLQVIAYLLNVEFQCCILNRKSADENVFKTYGQPICPPKHISIRHRLYLVVDDSKRSTVLGLFVTHDSTYLHYNLEQARMETDPRKKVEILLNTARSHRKNAESCNGINHIMALSEWAKTRQVYEEVRRFAPDEHEALLGNAKCLLELHKYKRAELFLMQHETTLKEDHDFWIILAIARRRQFNKKSDALIPLSHALEIHPESHEAKKQRRLIEGEIKAKESSQYKYTYNLDTHRSRSSTEHPTYNILSIDGGGIRGILPAVWLCELERKTRRPIATMFDMISGTSTGGIIAAGLSMPSMSRPTRLHDHLSDMQLPETCQPKYRASDILELYRTKHSELFTADIFSLGGVFWSKYSDRGRRSLFTDYFHDIRMADALTDLLIPAVSLQTHQIYSFTKRQPENHRIFDAVMATSSAPTYFAPYEINGHSFVDGGVQANNPIMEAYREATTKYGAQRKNVFVLSLGTGDYVPDPVHPEASRKLLFWYSQLTKPSKLIFDGPQNNLERHMCGLLQEKYHRWQVWFEDPIGLDDCREETVQYLIDTAREYIEEMECRDDRNRLGLVIEHLDESRESRT
uniref:PNPLA domain-containing protein n=1 Tax=Acrobeloides nanus TaxID=290746 RepID=A0A914D0K3_9BILA